MQKFYVSRERLPPFWNRNIKQVRDKLQKYVNESQQAQAVMKKARCQASVGCSND